MHETEFSVKDDEVVCPKLLIYTQKYVLFLHKKYFILLGSSTSRRIGTQPEDLNRGKQGN